MKLSSVKILQYKAGSESAKLLANELGIKRLKLEGSSWNPPAEHLVINWGSSTTPSNLVNSNFLNKPSAVAVATNKLSFFKAMEEDIVPEWTTEKQMAILWASQGHTVVCRTKLSGHSGEGIVLIEGAAMAESTPDAPLYTKYVKKTDEYRIHIFKGELIDIQQKKRKTDVPDSSVNWKIRNLAGGFIYARENVAPNEVVVAAAVKSYNSLDLDFGAFDVIYNKQANKAFVLEVNSAPGISGTTLTRYRDTFKNYINQ